MTAQITIRGARPHNLKNITLSIPKNQLVVLTGLCGSGNPPTPYQAVKSTPFPILQPLDLQRFDQRIQLLERGCKGAGGGGVEFLDD